MECEQLEGSGLLFTHLHWLKVIPWGGDEPARVFDRLEGVKGVTTAVSEEKEALHAIILLDGLQALLVFYLLQKNSSITSIIICEYHAWNILLWKMYILFTSHHIHSPL